MFFDRYLGVMITTTLLLPHHFSAAATVTIAAFCAMPYVHPPTLDFLIYPRILLLLPS